MRNSSHREVMREAATAGRRKPRKLLPDRPTDTEWVEAIAGLTGVKNYYESIRASESAMVLLQTIEKCLRYGAALSAGMGATNAETR